MKVDASSGAISSLAVTNTSVTLSGTVAADTVTLSKATLSATKQSSLAAGTITLDGTTITNLASNPYVTLKASDASGTLTVTKADGSNLTDAEAATVRSHVSYGTTVSINGTTETVTASEASKAKKAEAVALGQEMQTAATAIDMEELAAANTRASHLSGDLFSNSLPKASDLKVAGQVDAYEEKAEAYAAKVASLTAADFEAVETEVGENTSATKNISTISSILSGSTGFSALDHASGYEEGLKEAVVDAGRTLVAPVVGASRAAELIGKATEASIIRRTETLRNPPPKTVQGGKPEGKDALVNDHIWADVRYNEVEINTNDYCGKTNTALTNYQLGCDRKFSDKDYIGAFVSTSAGSFDFYSHSTATANGNIHLAHAFGGGIYGTHIFDGGHYVDYLVYGSKFDSDFKEKNIKWGTRSLGAMFLLGWKKTIPHGTVNPYIAFSANKTQNEDMIWCGNVLATRDQNKFGVKVGVDYAYKGGMFGGIAYSRSHGNPFDSSINDIALPSLDNDEQILYLKLGYRGKLNQHTNFDIMGEQYLLDYNGWSMNGKLEIGF